MPDSVIVDTSSLIALEKVGLLNILCDLYSEVLVPESVVREFGTIGLPCLSVRRVASNLLELLITDLNLGKGEAEAITLASETGYKIVVDDSKARRVAQNMGLKITGTIGILLRAERSGLIESAEKKVRELKTKGFYISDELLERMARLRR